MAHGRQERSRASDRKGPARLSRFEHWTTDCNGEPILEWDPEAHAGRCEKWAPRCPDGNRQRAPRALGFRERNVGELELRVALGGNDRGVCEIVVEEHDDEVYVRVLVCCDDADDDDSPPPSPEYIDCPVRVWLEQPLGDRAVIDVDSDEELPLFVPDYLDTVPQHDHGYRPANRRRRSREYPWPPDDTSVAVSSNGAMPDTSSPAHNRPSR